VAGRGWGWWWGGIDENVFARHITPAAGCSAAGCSLARSGGSRGALRQQQGGQHQQNKQVISLHDLLLLVGINMDQAVQQHCRQKTTFLNW
jgi:hypothetical protein